MVVAADFLEAEIVQCEAGKGKNVWQGWCPGSETAVKDGQEVGNL